MAKTKEAIFPLLLLHLEKETRNKFGAVGITRRKGKELISSRVKLGPSRGLYLIFDKRNVTRKLKTFIHLW